MLMYLIYISRFSGSFVKLRRSRRSITNATICMQVFYICLTVQSKWNHRVEVTEGLVILNKSLCSAYWLYMSFVSYHNLLMREWFVTHLIYCTDPAEPLVQQWYITVQFNIILHTKAIVNYLTISHGHSVYASYTITYEVGISFSGQQ